MVDDEFDFFPGCVEVCVFNGKCEQIEITIGEKGADYLVFSNLMLNRPVSEIKKKVYKSTFARSDAQYTRIFNSRDILKRLRERVKYKTMSYTCRIFKANDETNSRDIVEEKKLATRAIAIAYGIGAAQLRNAREKTRAYTFEIEEIAQ